jgi:two-component system, oxyanion-binding sensor
MADSYRISAGFLPLLDSSIMVLAHEKEFAAREGVELTLFRETSWASIRDRMAVGHFDVAHLLAPMPIAYNLGLTPLSNRTIAPFSLGLGGNAVTVSSRLWQEMEHHGAIPDLDPAHNGEALRQVVAARRAAGQEPLRFAVVHRHSGHNYELRYWLAGCGIDPDADVEIVYVPPPLMPDALLSATIDGCCVGEPWNTVAASSGIGRIATVKAAIWKSSPEKVLGASASWAEANPEALAALLRGLHHAAVWAQEPGNREEIAAIMAGPAYLDRPPEAVLPALSGRIGVGGGLVRQVDDFLVPFAKAANFPWVSHALWFYSQMVRWGHVRHSADNARIARATYRPDLYRAALQPLGAPMPSANAKVEGALTAQTPVGSPTGRLVLGPDGFFDGRIFDPDRLDEYLASQRPA